MCRIGLSMFSSRVIHSLGWILLFYRVESFTPSNGFDFKIKNFESSSNKDFLNVPLLSIKSCYCFSIYCARDGLQGVINVNLSMAFINLWILTKMYIFVLVFIAAMKRWADEFVVSLRNLKLTRREDFLLVMIINFALQSSLSEQLTNSITHSVCQWTDCRLCLRFY